jgi:hypothetical protein
MMPDQPLPVAGGVSVTPVARAEFLRMLLEREVKGVATYGMSLTTNNGRDVFRDLLEELIDAWQYAIQALLETEELAAENAALKAELIRCRGERHDA